MDSVEFKLKRQYFQQNKLYKIAIFKFFEKIKRYFHKLFTLFIEK